MKKSIFALLLLANINVATSAPAAPGFRTLVQPNGEQIDLELKGDEFFSWQTTREGEVVVYNRSSKSFEYAVLNESGTDLVASGVPVGASTSVTQISSSVQSNTSVPSLSDISRIWKMKRSSGFK